MFDKLESELSSIVSELDRFEIFGYVETVCQNKTLENESDFAILCSGVDTFFSGLEARTKRVKAIFLEMYSNLEADIEEIKSNMENVGEWVNLNTAGSGSEWSKAGKIMFWLATASIVFATVVELILSYKLLTTNIPAFSVNRFWSIFFGLVPIMLALTLKLVCYIDLSKPKRKFWVWFICCVFSVLQFVVYKIQLPDTQLGITDGVDALDVYADSVSTGLLSSLSWTINYEAMLYLLASTSVFIFVFVVYTFAQQQYYKYAPPKRRNDTWVKLKDSLVVAKSQAANVNAGVEYSLDISSNILNKKEKNLSEINELAKSYKIKAREKYLQQRKIKERELSQLEGKVEAMREECSKLENQIAGINEKMNENRGEGLTFLKGQLDSLKKELSVLLDAEREARAGLEDHNV